MDYDYENNGLRTAPERDPDEIRSRAARELRDENLRHEDAMRRLNKEHENGMKTLKSSSWKGLGCCVGNWFSASSGTTTPPEPNAHTTWSEDDEYRFGGRSSGRCLIIWNRPGNYKEESASLVRGFSRLGFDVSLLKNKTDSEIPNILGNITKHPVQVDGSFVCVFVGKGTSDYIKTTDGKKIKIRSIVEMFSPHNATGIRHCSKVLLFQCDADSRRRNFHEEREPNFTPKYDDAFVLCSTHSNFLPALEDFMKTTRDVNFENTIDGVIDKLLKDSTPHETITLVSTLRTEIFLSLEE